MQELDEVSITNDIQPRLNNSNTDEYPVFVQHPVEEVRQNNVQHQNNFNHQHQERINLRPQLIRPRHR